MMDAAVRARLISSSPATLYERNFNFAVKVALDFAWWPERIVS